MHSSYQEGLPVALMEAMAAGVTCVVSEIRGNTDLLADEKGGYILQAEDFDGFAAALDKVLSDKQSAEMMGRHNTDSIKPYDIKNILSLLDDVYNKYSPCTVDGNIQMSQK